MRLQQILWNLAHNAVKFTPRGGRLSIDVSGTDDRAVVTVADTGQGIEPAFLPHVFDMFRQADGTSTRTAGGLGIGLALVRQLVELHDGSVEVHSAGAGRGTTFVVSLPLHAGVALPVGEVEPSAGRLAGLRILVVDDAEDAAEMLGELLVTEGAAVAVAMTADAALRSAERAAFDLIISDISMPDMDGYQLLGKLRELSGYRDTPAIALTGLSRASDAARAREVGFAAHLTKPVQFANLVEVARGTIDRTS